MIGSVLIAVLIVVLIFIVSSLPLYFAVVFLGGKTSLLKTMLINLISGVVVAVINFIFKTWGGIIAFIVLIWIYREAFRVRWWKAIFVWFIQLVFIAAMYIILGFILVLPVGISFLL